MSQTLNSVPTFDGTNYGYWKARMRFFLKSIGCGILLNGEIQQCFYFNTEAA